MANSNSDNLVAVFVDFENLLKSYHRQIHGYQQEVEKYEVLEWKKILDFVRGDTGRIVIKRAYADWVLFKDKQRELLEHGFELINTPSRGEKNAADIKIVIDAISILNEQDKNIHNFFVVSGDGDFIDLVHHLHANGKIVKGMGVSGTTSNYLTKVCDEFCYYDILVKPPSQEVDIDAEGKARPVSFDVSEARQILRETLEKFEDGWIDAAFLKKCMQKKDPAFNERNYGFEKFRSFLDAQDDIVKTRPKNPLGLEIKKVIQNGTAPDYANPEYLLDRYLSCLAKEKVHMRPTEHRKALIFTLYDIILKNHDISFTEAIEKLSTLKEKEAPYISYTNINDTAHALFHCKCFEFNEKITYPEGTKLWDKKVSIINSIGSANVLLTWCDRELLKKIRKRLEPQEKIDPEIAARLLYGKEGGPYKKVHVEKLIKEIEIQN